MDGRRDVFVIDLRHFNAAATGRGIHSGIPATWMSVLPSGFEFLFTYPLHMPRVVHTVARDAATWSTILTLGAASFLDFEAVKAVSRRLNNRSM